MVNVLLLVKLMFCNLMLGFMIFMLINVLVMCVCVLNLCCIMVFAMLFGVTTSTNTSSATTNAYGGGFLELDIFKRVIEVVLIVVFLLMMMILFFMRLCGWVTSELARVVTSRVSMSFVLKGIAFVFIEFMMEVVIVMVFISGKIIL